MAAVVTAAAVLGAVGWLLVRPVTYRATETVFVTPEYTTDASWLGLSVLRVNPAAAFPVFETAAAMIDSPPAAERTARQLGRGWTAGGVSSAVTVAADIKTERPDGSTDTVAVQASAGTPRLAARIAYLFTRDALQAMQQIIRRQATLRLRAAKTYGPEQAYELKAVRAGLDPMFKLVREVKAHTDAEGGPALRFLGLSLIGGIGFAAAACLLAEAVRRRPQPRAIQPGDATG
jgi:hypothetical protein